MPRLELCASQKIYLYLTCESVERGPKHPAPTNNSEVSINGSLRRTLCKAARPCFCLILFEGRLQVISHYVRSRAFTDEASRSIHNAIKHRRKLSISESSETRYLLFCIDSSAASTGKACDCQSLDLCQRRSTAAQHDGACALRPDGFDKRRRRVDKYAGSRAHVLQGIFPESNIPFRSLS